MNFFGHAVVARWRTDDSEFLLGAMLPDLCAMLGIRPARAVHATISAGVDFHHRTDAAFHGCQRFVWLCTTAVDALTAEGVGRGTARAVAHVGTELLLDGLLSHETTARDSYTHALTRALDARLSETVATTQADRDRLHRGLTSLARAPVPEAYRDTAFVVERLRSLLSARPRLAMQHQDLPAVHAEITRLKAEVSAVWPELLEQVRDRLDR